jgi:diguanylate cyclase (GGDEF)-like protein/PAS domain S-box-containing protein
LAKRRKTAVKRSGSKRPVRGAVSTRLSTEWYWEQDAELRFTHVEVPAGAPLEQRLAALIVGKRRWETGVHVEGGWDAHRRVLDAHKPFHDVLLWRDFEDGTRRYIITSGEPMYDEAGRFRGYRGVARDITEQKRSEQLLRLEHQITREFAAGGEVAAALKSALRAICESENWQLGRYVKVDEARGALVFGEAWGIPEPAVERYIEESRAMVYPPGHGLVGKVWQSGKPVWVPDLTGDPRVARPGLARDAGLRGALVVPVASEGRTSGIFIFHTYRIRQPDERLLQTMTVIGRQIAQLLKRAEAEAAMRESQDRLHSLVNLSSDWFWEQDTEYRFTRIEGRAVAGNDPAVLKRLIGARRWETGLQIAGDWDAHRADLEARRPFHDLAMSRVMSDGSIRHISVSGEPVFAADGTFTGYRGVGRDITAQTRDEQLLRLEHQVALLLSDAKDTVAGVKAVMRAVCEAEGWACGRFFRVDETAGELAFEYGWGTGGVAHTFLERSAGLRFKPGQGLAGIVWQSGEPLWSTDTSRDPRVMAKRLTDGTGIRGAFVFPVVSGGKRIAVLSFTSEAVRKPDERLLRAASVIGAQIGQFLQRKDAEDSLRESEARFRSLTQMSSDFFWESDGAHRITDMAHGPNYAGKLGKEKLLGKTAWEFPSAAPDEAGWERVRQAMEAHLPVRDFEFGRPLASGGTRYFSVSGDPYFAPDGRFMGYRGVGRDITEAVLARERIASLAYSDALTGLANRTSLGPTLEQAVERTRRRGSKLAGVFIDLDGFKEVNDLHGHDAGDRLLIELARRLRSQLRAGDPVTRLGGDEFFVVLEDVQQTGPVDSVARKLLSTILEPFDVGVSMPVRISGSIGISVFPDDAGDGATLVKHADMAMYAAKQAGKNGYRFFKEGPAANDPKTQASEKNA